MRRARTFLLAAIALLWGGCAFAQVTTCNGSNVSMSLGAYSGFQPTDLDSSGVLTVTCTRNGGPPTTLVTVGIGPSGVSGTIATRQLLLVAGPDRLNYNLYRDAGRSLVWGETVGGNTLSQNLSIANNTSGTLNFTIFGRVTALQDVRPGSYGDNLTLTVTF